MLGHPASATLSPIPLGRAQNLWIIIYMINGILTADLTELIAASKYLYYRKSSGLTKNKQDKALEFYPHGVQSGHYTM